MNLHLHLFGALAARSESGQEVRFRDNKVRALLAYLVVERDQAQAEAISDPATRQDFLQQPSCRKILAPTSASMTTT